MSSFVVEDRSGTGLLTITVPGLVVRALTVLPVVVALGALHAVAPEATWWPSAVLVVLAALAAEVPDSGVGLVTLGGLMAWWLLTVDQPATWWALLVACCALTFHVALAFAAAGPPGCSPTAPVVRRLLARYAGVLAATGALAVVVELADTWGEPPALTVGITLGLVGALPWLAARRTD